MYLVFCIVFLSIRPPKYLSVLTVVVINSTIIAFCLTRNYPLSLSSVKSFYHVFLLVSAVSDGVEFYPRKWKETNNILG